MRAIEPVRPHDQLESWLDGDSADQQPVIYRSGGPNPAGREVVILVGITTTLIRAGGLSSGTAPVECGRKNPLNPSEVVLI